MPTTSHIRRPARRALLRGPAAAAGTVACAVGIAFGVAPSTVPFGRLIVVAFLVSAPALAIARLLPSLRAAVAVLVGIGGAVSVNAVVAQSMLSTNTWSPRGGVVAVGAIAALLWLAPRPERRVLDTTTGGVQ